ncbi:DUF262 domain-containing protein [Erwinia rhapontici]|uniref:DUF262 domain-containing protein n=1 Tax=Erwinia rhapontici TaxID=55212 RepID=UPI003BA2A9DD
MNIIPESKSLEKILSGLETKYCVPDYQRDYSWSVGEVETLWLDIMTSYKQSSEYFMGTIVLKKDDKNSDLFDIVDGQQRLATFSILFSVIASLASEYGNVPSIFKDTLREKSNHDLAKRISSIAGARLREPSEPDNYFLKLNRKDNDLFQEIIKREGDNDIFLTEESYKVNKSDKRLLKTKKTFSKCITEDLTGVNALNDLLKLLIHIVKNLKFITIEVETDYDAFLLFESLNSKGMDLSVADLVKNKILMRANGNEDKNESLLANWEQMIDYVEDSRLSPVDFLRVYWEAVRGANITKKELYKNVGKFIDSENTDIEAFSKELRNYAEELSEYASSTLTFPECMHRQKKYLQNCGEINTLKYTTCYPVFMYARRHRPEIIDDLTKLSLSFLFRWITVSDLSVGGAKKTFDLVLNKMRDISSTNEQILEVFYQDQDKINDEAFVSALKQFRTQDNQIAKYILSKYYLTNNKAQSIPNYGEVHLEHVLPQQPSLWIESNCFETPAGTQIKDFIYNLGNMTLLHKPINQKVKNSIFSSKVKEFSDSIFEETKSIYLRGVKGEKWGAIWISERTESIAEIAPKIWPLKL